MIFKIFISVLSLFFVVPAYSFDATSKEIKVVIPFPPGGGVDQTFRNFEKYANKKGIKFSPIFKPGAEGLIGMNEIAGMPKDGYHVSIGTAGTVATQRIKNPSAELMLVTAIRNSIPAFVTHKDSGILAFEDLFKKSSVNWGIGAPGQKMIAENVEHTTKGQIKIKQIPYKGGSQVVQDIIGNHVEMAALPFNIVKSHIDSGTLRLISVGSQKRLRDYPMVPTVKELINGRTDFDAFVFILPKGTDSEAVKFWNDFLKEYLSDKDVQESFMKEYNDPVEFGNKKAEQIVRDSVERLSK